ncbi:hypothetical protein ABAC460_12080 [Asticcacaulis sp. AC460]|uniref:hypothetical protein n=1 Tax=Asticcacaulis sp. AC460 TaxID=1282360 RepID=UPI0003C3C770|nr:hypothetical protein [Asticcacaulis sp. AC460]ESQ89600.1 hypothetical protein ABAC460_12080 [Asticcacaulis sp. AC460]
MAKSATHFQPTTDTFGELTLRARRFGSYFTSTAWDSLSAGIDRKALTHTLIMVLFLAGFLAALAGLFVFDQMAFGAEQPSQVYYGGVSLIDYN